ncbi:DUF4839 domain-containing protein [Rhodococcus sp. BP-149]|uniref:DUF4839 domain-containing protein n=1 Tax=unclassified Rhodococcus (in: high G+C Gram-positive bacteria) TaxID=192944 RepID=UPI001C9B1A21|nr:MULTISPECIES: DUF4839 domain-containing protein [unclassified Rhodococcus (in: high G+C Gram-positive bacteria)]MBY6687522.1 DUF4839 domain-containing protein [Rhodococcus sp. BP-288]MBY6695687.1 DUF4839 domain-containing protein [Rhodococcus sp. BP-188]MBY6700515.1 DUF4839 domain-containing protein [Rhodococcus sp. BP-285]MBY6704462.1 DUF4839 domain-containing protein [Rhodococcus sp. BP-283]MBY6713640.1 DUF4839 domain-containing protein [Rhodococcus sp. BP-160]
MNTNADGDVTYESKTVRVVRGTESRTVAKWNRDGWEVVSQSPGTLRTEITFRRPAPKSHRTLLIIGGGVAAIAIAIIIGIGVVTENRGNQNGSDGSQSAAASESSVTNEQAPTGDVETVPVPVPVPKPSDVVLTAENTPVFAALLATTDYCSPDVAAFADANRGRTISFPGNVGAINPYEGASTRYLILINAGDYSETSAPGPAFQFRDVNTSNDLRWADPAPDTINVGTNLDVTAKVDRYEESSCLFLLDPVATAVR